DDDAVRPHAQRVPHELPDTDLALALDILGPRFQPEDMTLVEPELRRVLDRDDALAVGDRGRQGVEQRRLAGARAARDEDVELGRDAALEEVDGLARQGI